MYRFRNVMGRAAGQVKIQRVESGDEPVSIDGPVGERMTFDY